jgi:hypothetical protein
MLHAQGGRCHEITTENSRETIEGAMDIQANVTLELQPTLAGNISNGRCVCT